MRAKIYLLIEILFYFTIPLIWIIPEFKWYVYIILATNIILRTILYKTKKKITDNRCECPYILSRIVFNVFMSKEEQNLKLRTDWVLDTDKISVRYNLKNDTVKQNTKQ